MKKMAVIPLALAALLVAVPVASAKKPTNRARVHALEKQVRSQRAQVRELWAAVATLQLMAATQARQIADMRACFEATPAGTEDVLTPDSRLFTAGTDVFFQPEKTIVVTHHGPDFLAYVKPECAASFPVTVRP